MKPKEHSDTKNAEIDVISVLGIDKDMFTLFTFVKYNYLHEMIIFVEDWDNS